jgi:dimeric dUTPase (all-alpha-NTP-PPase superfamily)
VELAEFANEVAWFKYWKQSHVMKLDKVLEELADVMHFFLSVGVSRNYHTFVSELEPKQWLNLPMDFLFRSIMENSIDSSGRWKSSFEQLIAIGLMLGFEEEQMLLAYHLKNQENIERQLRNY